MLLGSLGHSKIDRNVKTKFLHSLFSKVVYGVVKFNLNMFQTPAGERGNQVNQVRCAKEFGNSLRLLVTVLWTGRKRVSLAARGAMLFLWGQFVGSKHVHQRQQHGRCGGGVGRTKIALWGWRRQM